MSCAKCGEVIDALKDSFLELECGKPGHFIHMECVENECLECPHQQCRTQEVSVVVGSELEQPLLGDGRNQVQGTSGGSVHGEGFGQRWLAPILDQGTREERETAQRIGMLQESLNEPLRPPHASNVFSKAAASLIRGTTSWFNSGKTSETSTDPHYLLKRRYPLEKMVGEKGLGLTELINSFGVNINDFLINGYTIEDMCLAFPRMNKRQGIEALQVLGLSSEHFRLIPDSVCPAAMAEYIGYHPDHLLTQFGYTFAPASRGGWTLPQMLHSGLTMKHVIDAGLRYISEWSELIRGATPEQMTRFGFNKALFPRIQKDPQPLPQPVIHPPAHVDVHESLAPLYGVDPTAAPHPGAVMMMGSPQRTYPMGMMAPMHGRGGHPQHQQSVTYLAAARVPGGPVTLAVPPRGQDRTSWTRPPRLKKKICAAAGGAQGMSNGKY